MAIKIKSASGVGLIGSMGGRPWEQEVEIIADTEAEITALGETVTVGDLSVIPTAGSIAHTAGYKAIYELSPAGLWVKV
jgi:hypothetical protein